MSNKVIGSTGLTYLWGKIKAWVSSQISGKADKIPEVNHGTSDTTFELTPNVMHIWGEVSSLTLTLPTDSNAYLDEFMFTFTSGSTPTNLGLPQTVDWARTLTVQANKTYQVTIVNGLAGYLTDGMSSEVSGDTNVIETVKVNGTALTPDNSKAVDILLKTINNTAITGTGNISISGDTNVIESVSVNGTAQTITSKNVDITVPTKVSDLTNDSGFTTNTGTITGITMNNTSKGTSGVVDLGTVITSETALSKGTTSGNGNAVTDVSVSGHQITLTKGKTFLESFTESDPVFTASAAHGITSSDISNWNGKTSNTGTITGVSVNGTSVATSGVANITSVPASILSGAIPSGVTATTQSSGDNSTKVATTAYVDSAISGLPEPMLFKGSLGTGGTITSLPTASSSNEGYTYKVITDGTYASQTAKVGDTFISDGSAWVLIPSGDEPSGTVTSITIDATSPIAIDSNSAITSSGTRTISHANSGVTAGTYRSVTVNATGHVTAGSNPTTLSGYGITDANISNGVITLGSNTITPITDVSGKADKTATVSTVTYDTTNHKITKTINGTTTDVVTAETIVNDSGLALPSVTSSDNGSILYVSNGAWVKQNLGVQVFYTGSSEPSNSLGNNGDIYLQS